MTTPRHRTSASGPSVTALLAWAGSDRVVAGEAGAPAFGAAALTRGAMPRSAPGRHTAPRGGGPSLLLRAVGARRVTAGVALICSSVLAAAVSTTDGTLGPQSATASPELLPRRSPPAGLPGVEAPVQRAAMIAPVSGAAPATSPAVPSPQPGAGAAPALPGDGGGGSGGGASGVAGGDSAAPAPAPPEPQGSGRSSAPPADDAPEEQQQSPVERVTEPVERVTEPVKPVTEPVKQVAEPVTSVLGSPLS
jgi:hypothetical protein